MSEKERSIPFCAGSLAGVIPTAQALVLALLILCLPDGRAMAVDVGFSAPVNFPVGAQPYSVAVADIDGDSKLDLVVPSVLGNNISVLLGNGDDTFHPAITYSMPADSGPLITGDFNGDSFTADSTAPSFRAASVGSATMDGTISSFPPSVRRSSTRSSRWGSNGSSSSNSQRRLYARLYTSV